MFSSFPSPAHSRASIQQVLWLNFNPQDYKIHTSANRSNVASLRKKVFNAAHVQIHQHTCFIATIATLNHKNTKTRNLSDTPRTETIDNEAKRISGITRKTNMRCFFLLVHRIVPFATRITLRCTLHHCSSRHIHHWKLCCRYILTMKSTKIVTTIAKKVASDFADRNHQIHFGHARRRLNVMCMATTGRPDFGMCERPFLRFTPGNLVTTSPSFKW